MLIIKIEGLDIAEGTMHSNESQNQWIKWRSLKLRDTENGQIITEWFYVAACSPQYLSVNTSNLTASEHNAILVTDVFSEDDLLKFASAKFEKMHFTNWDDYYKKMEKEFAYED